MNRILTVCFALLIMISIITVSCDKDRDCASEPATYTAEMKAIIDAKCVTCHKVGGSAEALGIYTSYLSMTPNLDAIWKEVDEGRMPKGGKLSAEELDAFRCWQAAGFPEN
jgi:mono/diheme cytochrome c family protein